MKNAISIIAKNTIFILLSKFIDPLISLLLVISIARLLGVNGLGQYSFVKATFTIFLVISTLGLEQLITRDVAKNKQAAALYLINLGVLNIIFSIVMAVSMSLFVYFSHYPPEVVTASIIMSSALIAASFSNSIHAVFGAFERFEFNAMLISGENIVRVMAAVIALLLGGGLVTVIVIITATRFLGSIMGLFLIHKKIIPLKWYFDFRFLWRQIKAVPTFSLISIFSVIYWRLDVIMLSKFCGMTEVGIYSAAFRIMEIIKAIPLSVKQALFPVKARKFASDKSILSSLANRSIKYLMIILLPIAMMITLVAHKLMLLFYGNQFQAGAVVLQILIWTIVPYGIAMMLANVLVTSGNQRIDLWANIFGVAANLMLNLVLIPRMGVIGASLATLISIFCFVGFQILFVRRLLFSLSYRHIFARPLLAVMLMAGTGYFVRNWSLAAIIILVSAIYLLLLNLLHVLTTADWRLLPKVSKDMKELLFKSPG
ncbi:MAG: flippase [candidate division KSB1 bacterium]|nr:flippase [candidate division KSB1 bacterium]